MAVEDDDDRSPLDAFLSGPGLDLSELGEPPLRDGEDSLLTRDRVALDDED